MSLFSRIFRRDEAGGEADPGSEPKEGAPPEDASASAASAAEPATSTERGAEPAASIDVAPSAKASEQASAQAQHAAALAERPKGEAGPAHVESAKEPKPPALPGAAAKAQRTAAAASTDKKVGAAPKPLPAPAARVSSPQISSTASADKGPPTKKTVHEPARPAGSASKPDAAASTNASAAAARAKSPVANAVSAAKTMPMGTVARSETSGPAQPAAPTQTATGTQPTMSAQPATAATAGRPTVASEPAVGLSQFKAAAAPSMRVLIDFMLELRGGCAPSVWANDCLVSLRALAPLAAKVEPASIKHSLDVLLAVLERVSSKPDLEEPVRAELLLSCSRFAAQAGLAVDLEAERARRSTAVVGALLGQIEGLYATHAERVLAAGFTSFERLAQATPEDLGRGAGIDHDLAERVLAAFRGLAAEFSAALEPSRSVEKQRLSALLEELRALEQRFERASAGWSNEDLAARRVLRTERARSVQRIHAVLARIGELDRIAALERLPYAAKVDHLASYLGQAEKARVTAS